MGTHRRQHRSGWQELRRGIDAEDFADDADLVPGLPRAPGTVTPE
jgi:hypothetical protein